jgi:hypothetical protein
MKRPASAFVIARCVIAALVSVGSAASADLPMAARPGGRVLVDAHNCYPEHDRFADRIDRALATGLPVAIEQDLVWYRDPATGVSRSIVSHAANDEPFTGREPSLKDHFFERIRPLVEQALRENHRDEWPLIVLNLDLKSNEPEHHAALWKTLGEYESWLTTAERVADGARVAPLDVRPVLVLTGNPSSQQLAFHDEVPVGAKLRLFGAIAVDVEARVGRGPEAVDKLATVVPEELIASKATNYRRWANFPWAVVERGGQRKAEEWVRHDASRLKALVDRAHAQGLWIRFYTLNGHAAGDGAGWTASYNFGSLAAAQARWRAARAAGVDFIASDQYEALAAALQAK